MKGDPLEGHVTTQVFLGFFLDNFFELNREEVSVEIDGDADTAHQQEGQEDQEELLHNGLLYHIL